MTDATNGRWICVLRRLRDAPELEVLPEAGQPPPAVAHGGHVTVVFDGSLADRRGLESTLGPEGTAMSPVDLVLAAYTRLGDDLLTRISGAFALLVWDAAARRLLCARDPVGLHPLLYAVTTDGVVVGSFVESILDQPGVPGDVDRVAVASRILEAPLRPAETLFAAVRRVPPGHALELTPGGSRLFRYWDPGEPGSDLGISIGDAVDRFESLLRRATERSMGDGPAAVFLSGGIDSALVASVATATTRDRRLPRPLGLALLLESPDVDEEANQRAIVGDLDLQLVTTSLDEAAGDGGLLRATLAVSASGSAGPADIVQAVYDHLAREGLRRGCTTVLNGQGGDEWLLPPPVYAADRLRSLDLPAVWRLWQAWFHHYPRQSRLSTAERYLWTWGARPFVREAALRLEPSVPRLRQRRARGVLDRIPGWLAPDPALRRDLAERMLAAVGAGGRLDELARTARRGLLDRPDRPGIAEEAFAMRRRLGVRLEMPLLDADLLRFLIRLPADVLVHDGRAKALARAVVSERLPSFGGHWPRTVSGDRYFGALVERETVPAWREAGGTPLLSELDVVDGAAVERQVASGRSPTWLWPATNVDVWLRACLGRAPVDAGPS